MEEGVRKKGPQKGFYTGLWDASGLEGNRIHRLLGFGVQGFLGFRVQGRTVEVLHDL